MKDFVNSFTVVEIALTLPEKLGKRLPLADLKKQPSINFGLRRADIPTDVVNARMVRKSWMRYSIFTEQHRVDLVFVDTRCTSNRILRKLFRCHFLPSLDVFTQPDYCITSLSQDFQLLISLRSSRRILKRPKNLLLFIIQQDLLRLNLI